MIYLDNILEKGSIFLRNLNINSSNTAKDVWSNESSSYGFYSVPYEYMLGYNRLYYVRYTYKFTTTNQSPTWVAFYVQGGSASFGTNISNPVAGTEYTVSAIGRANFVYTNVTLTSGTIYNGASNAIAGVKSQVKNVMFYDITELAEILRAASIATTDAAVKTWCDNNLEYVPRYYNYDISNLITDAVNKLHIKKGTITTNTFVETDGLDFYAINNSVRTHKYFDEGIGVGVYNNSGGGTVTHTRINASEQDSPFKTNHPYILKITTNGTASPGAGGFVCSHSAAANRIVIERFVAKVPVGYTVYSAYNNQGQGASVRFISKQAGTGEWEEYAILYQCGATPGEGKSFSNGGHVYISGSNNTNVTWYVAYCMSAIITDNPDLKNYTVLGNVDRVKEGYYFTRKINTINLIPNGQCYTQDTSLLTSGWTFDTTDTAGEAVASIVQPVGATTGYYGGLIPIRPGVQYKLSYWIKCKQDMSSFLTAIIPYLNDGTTALEHGSVVYYTGTKTQLTVALTSGSTTLTVKNNANWADRTYGGLGFRSGAYICYHDKGSWNPNGSSGVISGISGSTVIQLKTAYTGSTIPVNTYVVEKYDGGTYPYPIQKSNLPTDNTWKYVEGYFGSNAIWDGASNSNWIGLPSGCFYIRLRLNLYTNNGTVPIKYADIKIEPTKAGSTDPISDKIQITGGN